MRVFIGGAHNGKREYVRRLIAEEGKDLQWFEAALPNAGTEEVVLAGLENWIGQSGLNEQEAVRQVMQAVHNRKVNLILTDIGRGIVPMNVEQRNLRDICGRLYQRLIAEAEEVTEIWYGMSTNLKKRGELH
ncbi:bifunctional adenosylcobinamide kinase/adenosylcobinamide-phosphate guanylyltransferase [Sporosarcina sp. CAU 1771]